MLQFSFSAKSSLSEFSVRQQYSMSWHFKELAANIPIKIILESWKECQPGVVKEGHQKSVIKNLMLDGTGVNSLSLAISQIIP